jgi:hypothetical protein
VHSRHPTDQAGRGECRDIANGTGKSSAMEKKCSMFTTKLKNILNFIIKYINNKPFFSPFNISQHLKRLDTAINLCM